MRDGGSSHDSARRPVEVFLLLGSNLGDRRRALESGVEGLSLEGVEILDRSAIYETEPTDITDQPWFLNLAVRGRTGLSPRRLLAACKRVESRAGRRSGPRFGPRVLDVDILLYGERVVETEELEIPHPRMHERRFALVPLLEIAPAVIDPRDGRPFADALHGLDEGKKVVRSASIAS